MKFWEKCEGSKKGLQSQKWEKDEEQPVQLLDGKGLATHPPKPLFGLGN